MLFPQKSPMNLELEEVEKTEKENWLVTLGYDEPSEAPLGRVSEALAGRAQVRKYKQFEMDGRSGQFLAMRIRKV
jgi:hypothetical protein